MSPSVASRIARLVISGEEEALEGWVLVVASVSRLGTRRWKWCLLKRQKCRREWAALKRVIIRLVGGNECVQVWSVKEKLRGVVPAGSVSSVSSGSRKLAAV